MYSSWSNDYLVGSQVLRLLKNLANVNLCVDELANLGYGSGRHSQKE